MNVRNVIRQIESRLEREEREAISQGSSHSDCNSHRNEMAILRAAYQRLYQMRALVGQLPPSPRTLRARIGEHLVRIVQRMLFWYTPQIHRIQNEITLAIESLCRLIELQESAVAALRKEVSMLRLQQGAPQPGKVAGSTTPLTPGIPAAFEFALQDHFRGPEADTMKKLSVWLTAIEEHLGALTGRWVDIGCGRGEWLSMSSRHGHDAHGIDLNPAAVLQCRSRNLNAEVIGAIEYLERNEDGSLAVITAFHVAEHLPSGELLRFVAVAARKLQPNGLLAIETPNPANLLMGAHHFWNDPTHQRPIPEALMRFAFEYFGLKVIRRLSLSPFPAEQHLAFSEIEVVRQLDDHLYGARDYGLLGCRCD